MERVLKEKRTKNRENATAKYGRCVFSTKSIVLSAYGPPSYVAYSS